MSVLVENKIVLKSSALKSEWIFVISFIQQLLSYIAAYHLLCEDHHF